MRLLFGLPPTLWLQFKHLFAHPFHFDKCTLRRTVMGYAQLVIGPAGSGKSTCCSSLYQHCEANQRTIHIVNLDPAVENVNYPVAVDMRELICLDDVIEELGLGPNGSLIYCTEHLEIISDEWLTEELDNVADDDYIVFDCPVDRYSMVVSFFPLDLRKEHRVLSQIDNCIQYGEDDVKVNDIDREEE